MAYYCLFNGTGYLLGSNVPLLDSGGTSLRINIKKFNFPVPAATAMLFSQSSTNRGVYKFVVRMTTAGDLECFWGGNTVITITAAQILTAFGSSSLTCDEFGFEWTGATINLYKDGVSVFTKTGATRGTGGDSSFAFRVGAVSGSSASASISGSSLANNGATYGDFDLYVNGTLQRSWVMPSTGTTVPNSTSGGVLTQYGTWPSDNSEWVFYSSGSIPVTVTGGAAITFTANTVGGGKLIKFGGSNASFTFNTAGGGAVTRSSGSGIVFGVNGVGGGSILRRGGAGCAFSYNSAGGGVARRRGGALLTFTLSMVGGGEVIAGADIITGGAAITFSTGITGGGVVIRSGGSLTTFAVNSIGSGNTVRRGGSDIEFTVNMVGGGIVQGDGYRPVITAPVIMVAKKYTASPVSIGKTKAVPYNLTVQKTFRGQTCIL